MGQSATIQPGWESTAPTTAQHPNAHHFGERKMVGNGKMLSRGERTNLPPFLLKFGKIEKTVAKCFKDEVVIIIRTLTA